MHQDRAHPITGLISLAIGFELALAVVGAGIAWLAKVPLGELVWPAPHAADAVAYGVLATVPLMPLLAALLLCRWRPIVWLRRLVNRFVRQVFGRASLGQLALVSLAAGIGEEVLFRGAIQPIAVGATSPIVGVIVASLLFGLVHAASWSYFWLATLVGAYLGALTLWRGEILSAAVAHALYDFVALTCVSRGYFQRQRSLFTLPGRLPEDDS